MIRPPKKGSHSVGVHHQYCGELGKQANCQVVVTLSIANHDASLPIAYRLYLPTAWIGDVARRKEARIPENITFKTKPQIALEQIEAACAANVPRGVVLMDPAYGSDTSLRRGMRKLELSYIAGILSHVKVCAVRASGKLGPRLSVKALALSLPGMPGERSHGGKVRTTCYARALPACACTPLRPVAAGDNRRRRC